MKIRQLLHKPVTDPMCRSLKSSSARFGRQSKRYVNQQKYLQMNNAVISTLMLIFTQQCLHNVKHVNAKQLTM